MELGLAAIALSILIHALIRGHDMAVNFANLQAAMNDLASSIEAVAEAIRNPEVDTSSQEAADNFASQLSDAAASLRSLAAEEDVLDAGQPPEPPVE